MECIVKELRLLILSAFVVILTGCDQLGLLINGPILIVDLDAVAKGTGRQEIMQKELEFANLRLTEQLKLVASQLEESVSEEKNKLGKSASNEDKKQLENLVLQAQQQLLNSKNLAVQQSTEFRSDLILKFRKEVGAIAQEIASKSGVKLVLISNYETLWFDPASDITDEVIAIIRSRASSNVDSSNNQNTPSAQSEPVGE